MPKVTGHIATIISLERQLKNAKLDYRSGGIFNIRSAARILESVAESANHLAKEMYADCAVAEDIIERLSK